MLGTQICRGTLGSIGVWGYVGHLKIYNGMGYAGSAYVGYGYAGVYQDVSGHRFCSHILRYVYVYIYICTHHVQGYFSGYVGLCRGTS